MNITEMKSNLLKTITFLLLLSGLYTSSPLAQEIEKLYLTAKNSLIKGEYENARKQFKRLIKENDLTGHKYAGGYAETFLAKGEYGKGLKETGNYLSKSPENAFWLNAKGKFLTATGKYREAESTFRNAKSIKPDYPENTADLANILLLTGKKAEAKELYTKIFRAYKLGNLSSAEDISLAGLAASELDKFHEANQAFRAVYLLDKRDIRNLYHWADIFRQKFNNADAQKTFEEALVINPNSADLYAGYARAVNSFAAKEELVKKALEINPSHVESVNILAELHILDSQYEEAENVLKRSLEINPSSITSLANLASVYHFREDKTKFLDVEAKAKEINPSCGDFYITLVLNCGLRFRYKDAVYFGFKAVNIDPYNWMAHSVLGANLLRIGRADEARNYLNNAYENDLFNLFAKNSLDLIDEYDSFDVLESEHFRLKIHNSESVVLGSSILKIAEEAYDSLTTYYPYSPSGKILLEGYNDHADFGVRISGVPNLDLLGVCFGDIVAFDTPGAQQDIEYNWARTLWHELAHVMTIGLSDHRLPRWFTEGLSVYEEKRARPEWDRKMDIELYTALDQNKLLPLDRINSGFTRPEFPGQIMLSYYQSKKIVDFIIEKYGFGTIPELLAGFKERESQESIFLSVTGKDLKDINKEFFEYLGRDKDRFKDIIAGYENIFEKQKKKTFMDEFAFKKDNPFFDLCLKANELLIEKKHKDAEGKFLKALQIYPEYTETGSPYHGLAVIYRAGGERSKLIDILEKFLSRSEFGAAEARELAGYFSEKEDLRKAEYYYDRSFYVEPYNLQAHTNLAELYKKEKLYNFESEQRRIVLALNPVDRANSYYTLATSLFNNGQTNEAKTKVLKALELAPGFRDAQKLLMQCLGRKKK